VKRIGAVDTALTVGLAFTDLTAKERQELLAISRSLTAALHARLEDELHDCPVGGERLRRQLGSERFLFWPSPALRS
jgi:hypothetical protein